MVVRSLTVVALLVCASACDRGGPPLEQLVTDLDVPMESLVTVNEDVAVTVHVHDGVTEFLMFRTSRFGGWELDGGDAKHCPASGGGVEDAAMGPAGEIVGGHEVVYSYFYGVKPSLSSIETKGTDAEWEIIDPSLGSWVIFLPQPRAERLSWKLLDASGEKIDSGIGTSDAYEFCAIR